MATIELARLSDHLDEEQIQAVTSALQEESQEELDFASNEDRHIIAANIDDDVFVDFRDRLEANDLDAEVYVPVEFEDVVQMGGLRVGSAYALQLVLESLREDFFVEDPAAATETEADDADDDFERDLDDHEEGEFFADDEGVIEMKDEQLRHVWRMMYKASQEALVSNLSLFLHD